ncbi:MAG: hypothetical protein BMS9Abin23_0395 [Thermodesulfobacteriota bacterium]|nr:MAG: hypothetical protein BMS9Abin23_0395 [Thermodesulfobacteriota bacterium]
MVKPSFSLSRKFFIFLIIIFLPVIAGFTYSYYQDKKIVESQVVEDLTIIANAYEAQVFAFLEMAKRMTVHTSGDFFVRDELEKRAAGVRDLNSGLDDYLVKEILPLDPSVTKIFVADLDARVVSSTDPSLKARDISKEVFFNEGKKGTSAVELPASPGEPIELAISSPVRSSVTGETTGVLTTIIPVSELDRVLSGGLSGDHGVLSWKRGRRKSMEAFLVNGKGRIIAGTFPRTGGEVNARVDTPPVRACLDSGREMSGFYKDFRGVDVAGASMCMPGLKWTLVVKYDAAEALMSVFLIRKSVFIVALVTSGLVFFLFFVFYKRTVFYLRKLCSVATAMAGGDYSVKIPVETGDEIGLLASAFNGMASEINERKEELTRTIEGLKKAQEVAKMGSWDWDLVKKKVTRSEEVYRIFGLKGDEFGSTFEAFLDFIHPDDREYIKRSLDDAIYNKKPYSVDYRIVRPDGEVRTLHGEAGVVFDATGKPLRMVGTVQDITERKKKEEEDRKTLDRIASQRGALLYITKRVAAGDRHLGDLLGFLTEISAKTLGVERVSVWLFNKDNTALRCRDLFELTPARHTSGEVVMAADYPDYFKALDVGRAIDAHDARSDPRTCGFMDVYLKPYNITSMLDAPMRMGGKVIGVVCHEHVGPMRRWAEDEITFAADIADQAVQAIVEKRRRAVEKALRASELRYRTLFDTASDAVVVIDGKEKIWGFNRTAEKIFGYSGQEILGRDVTVLMPERYRKAHSEAVKRFVETGKSKVAGEVREYEALRKDGTEFPISITMSPAEIEGGFIFLAIVRDITEQKKKEYELKKLSSVLQYSMNGVVITDPEGRIEYVNPTFEKMTGYSREEVMGRTPSILSSGETPVEVYRDLWDTIRSGRTWTGEFKNKKKTGAYYWSKIVISPVMGEDGRIKHFFAIQEDVTEKTVSERKLAHMATHDHLTGLLNRSRFTGLLKEWILCDGAAPGASGALFLINIDRFMFLNDTYGHAMGDVFLRRLGKFLNDNVTALYGKYRASRGVEPLVARLSGDEFAVFLPYVDAVAAVEVADELRKMVEEARLGGHGQSTISIGVVLYPVHGKNTGELLTRADAAMMRAKELGRNRAHLYRPEDRALEKMHSRLEWKNRIVSALKEVRFVPWFQPILSLKDGSVTHYEALARMIDEKGKILAPGAFIDTAEVFGLIGSMDRIIIRKALDLQEIMRAQGKEVCFSLNLSGIDLGDEEFLAFLKKEISGRDKASVVFEITETAAVKNMDKAMEFIKELKKMGCSFSLDDFGVGFTSFNYLKEMDVDYIKIDGSFIRRLNENPDDQLFVKAMIDVAHGMRIKTVAEFVENEETLALLKKFDVDYAQGYFIGRPGPPYCFSPGKKSPL